MPVPYRETIELPYGGTATVLADQYLPASVATPLIGRGHMPDPLQVAAIAFNLWVIVFQVAQPPAPELIASVYLEDPSASGIPIASAPLIPRRYGTSGVLRSLAYQFSGIAQLLTPITLQPEDAVSVEVSGTISSIPGQQWGLNFYTPNLDPRLPSRIALTGERG